MGVPIIFLIIAPLAGIIALQITPPFSSAAVILSLVFSACGLGLLYKYLLHPLRTLTAAVSRLGSSNIPAIGASCDLVRALEDSMKARETALKHDAAEACEASEKLQKEIQELRENRAVTLQAQQAALEVLRKAQTQLIGLATSVADQGHSSSRQMHDPQLFIKLAAELHRSECALLHAGQFWGNAVQADNPESALPEVFLWKDCYNTSIPVIDGQHKLLVSYINKLHRGMQNGCDKNLLLEILDELTGYAFTHFATEEMYFTRSTYPLADKHLEEHQQFRKTVTQLRDAVLDGKAFIDIALLEYLKTWLVEHIQRMDAGIAPYVTRAEICCK